MKNTTTQGVMDIIGIDLGDRKSTVCELNPGGEIIREKPVGTTEKQLEKMFGKRARARIAIEVGTHSAWVSRLLSKWGHEVLVANPRELALIYKSRKKTDKVDARKLARIARLDPDLLAPIQHRSAEAQADLAVLRSRDALVKCRTQLINHARGAVKSSGGRLPSCSSESFHRKVADLIPAEWEAAIKPIVEQIEHLTTAIRAYDQKVETMGEQKYPETERLKQVPGVGPLTSLTYILTIEDPNRFRKSRDVGPYLGLTPRLDQSGKRDPQRRITKAGDVCLRRLLISGAHYILGKFGPETDLRRWGLELAKRGGKNAKKRAVVAVGRKLSVLLHRLWVSGEVYEPNRSKAAPASRTKERMPA